MSSKFAKQLIFAALTIMLSPASFAQSGSAAGASSQGANPDLEYCPETLGTLAVYEDQQDNWYRNYYSRYPDLGSTVPLLRLMAQQSNCFVIVERGDALQNVMGERDLQASGELRDNSNFGKGQMVAADYTMSPSVLFAEKTGGVGGALGGLLRSKNSTLANVVGGLSKKEASTSLLLVDNRSSVQVAASTGSAQKFDFSGGLGAIGRSAGGALSGFTDTPEGKIIAAAFADSYNQMVRSLRNYKAQSVDGGLGSGGKLQIGQ
ncbi:MAG: CsgG/HfaB family protein [Acidiferrobacterales bacterium]|nr:CsgG/HfaB family protein [Acidiferrobacterales bacterium]